MSFAITGKKVGIQTPVQTMPLRPQGKPKTVQINPKTSIQSKTPTQTKSAVNNKQNPATNAIKVAQKKNQGENTLKDVKVQEKPALKKIEQVNLQKVQVEKQETKREQEQVKTQQQVWSEITVRYNHYKQKFPIKNGVLSFIPIEDKYSFGDLFKGNYQPVIKIFNTQTIIEPITTGIATDFTWKLQEGRQYRLQIEEDQEEESKYEKKVYKAPAAEQKCPCKKNTRVQEINGLLKQLKPQQFGSAKHRQLLEQRDLQDVLFT